MLHLRSTDLNIHPAGRINNFGKLVEVNRNIILNICMEGLDVYKRQLILITKPLPRKGFLSEN